MLGKEWDMKRYSLYMAGICTALATVALGCASNAEAATSEEKKPVVIGTEETDATESTGETVSQGEKTPSGPASDTESSADLQSACVYGPVSEITSDSITIDNRSAFSRSGEMVITFSSETPILDAQTGNPVDMTEAETGSIVYAYIGDAMTMSEPPITNGELLFVNVEEGAIPPVYTQIQEVERKDGEETARVKGEDGVTYTVNEQTRILPYLTRNIVTVDDLETGKKCAIWADAEGSVSRMVLFQ